MESNSAPPKAANFNKAPRSLDVMQMYVAVRLS